jgi:hypothetical protein
MSTSIDHLKGWAASLTPVGKPGEIGGQGGVRTDIAYLGPKFELVSLTAIARGDDDQRPADRWPTLDYTTRNDEVVPDLSWVEVVMPMRPTLVRIERHNPGLTDSQHSIAFLLLHNARPRPLDGRHAARIHVLGGGIVSRKIAKLTADRFRDEAGLRGMRLACFLASTYSADPLGALDLITGYSGDVETLRGALPDDLHDLVGLPESEGKLMGAAARYILEHR